MQSSNSQKNVRNGQDERMICNRCFKSLGVPAKYEIYTFLKQRDKATVGELVDLVGLTQPTVSYHLKDMQQNGLLKSEKSGKEVYYSVDPSCPHDNDMCVLEKLSFKGIKDA